MFLLKIEEFIHEQLHERYKHFIVYGPPMQGKTKLAKYIVDIFTGVYIDLLQEFIGDPNKKNSIDVFGPSKLINFLSRYSCTEKKLIIVDQMDFLINTWDDNQLREFLVFVDQNQAQVCYIFIMHNYRILERETPIKKNDKGKNRLLNIYEIQQGGTING